MSKNTEIKVLPSGVDGREDSSSRSGVDGEVDGREDGEVHKTQTQ